MAKAIEDFESAQDKKEHDFEIGDTVDVHVRIVEGEEGTGAVQGVCCHAVRQPVAKGEEAYAVACSS